MKRNFILASAVLVSLLLAINSMRSILTFRTTAGKVNESEERLEEIRRENEALKRELDYKKSDQFAEGEIRNKLGLAKPGETIVIIPSEDKSQDQVEEGGRIEPNWRKWWELFFGS